mmetsp:Transcript_51215/g.100591  ORF Transcript_51215/g.100591 Transcript_51215/m.100591 type:complete len:239 (+) Transcript_51215:1060-1776(+)
MSPATVTGALTGCTFSSLSSVSFNTSHKYLISPSSKGLHCKSWSTNSSKDRDGLTKVDAEADAEVGKPRVSLTPSPAVMPPGCTAEVSSVDAVCVEPLATDPPLPPPVSSSEGIPIPSASPDSNAARGLPEVAFRDMRGKCEEPLKGVFLPLSAKKEGSREPESSPSTPQSLSLSLSLFSCTVLACNRSIWDSLTLRRVVVSTFFSSSTLLQKEVSRAYRGACRRSIKQGSLNVDRLS